MEKLKLKNIKVLVWDVDGTLYPPQALNINQQLKNLNFKIIAETNGVSLVQAKKMYQARYPKIKSSTKTLSQLGCGSIAELARIFDEVKVPILQKKGKDEKLIKLFGKLKTFRHLVAANLSTWGAKKEIRALGLDLEIFEKFVCADTVGTTKPDLAHFQKVLEYTKLPADQHLMIGDREKVDLIPAKRLGMKTCLVWYSGSFNENTVDFILPTVYDIVNLLP